MPVVLGHIIVIAVLCVILFICGKNFVKMISSELKGGGCCGCSGGCSGCSKCGTTQKK